MEKKREWIRDWRVLILRAIKTAIQALICKGAAGWWPGNSWKTDVIYIKRNGICQR